LSILQRLGPSPVAEDQLIRDLQLPPAALTPATVELEMDGKVLRTAGGLLSKAVWRGSAICQSGAHATSIKNR